MYINTIFCPTQKVSNLLPFLLWLFLSIIYLMQVFLI